MIRERNCFPRRCRRGRHSRKASEFRALVNSPVFAYRSRLSKQLNFSLSRAKKKNRTTETKERRRRRNTPLAACCSNAKLKRGALRFFDERGRHCRRKIERDERRCFASRVPLHAVASLGPWHPPPIRLRRRSLFPRSRVPPNSRLVI